MHPDKIWTPEICNGRISPLRFNLFGFPSRLVFILPYACLNIRLLGPCFKTGRNWWLSINYKDQLIRSLSNFSINRQRSCFIVSKGTFHRSVSFDWYKQSSSSLQISLPIPNYCMFETRLNWKAFTLHSNQASSFHQFRFPFNNFKFF